MGSYVKSISNRLLVILTIAFVASSCTPDEVAGPVSPVVNPDQQLRERVEAVLASASDIPGAAIAVDVSDGVVKLSGSLACDDCGGLRTPGGTDTIQQSVGAIVRAVPGVEKVEFNLTAP